MIAVSWWRFRLLLAALTLSSLVGLACGRYCTARGCSEGLTISLRGGFDPDKTYVIDVNQLTSAGEAVPLIRCARTWPSSGNTGMECTSSQPFEADPFRIRLADQGSGKLQVIVSVDGAVVGQRDYDAVVASREINGEGCGFCTSGEVVVDFPTRPIWGAQGSVAGGSFATGERGGFMFEATRDQLSAEQIRLLSEMQAVPNPAEFCMMETETTVCFMRVIYYDNQVVDWRARPGDTTCTYDGTYSEQLVSFASFEAFREALGCWHSNELSAAADEAASGRGPVPALAPSAVCQHGLVATPGQTTTVGLEVPDEGAAGSTRPRRIEVQFLDPSTPVRLELYDPAGTTLLAQGTDTVPDPNDPSRPSRVIEHVLPAPGTYLLRVLFPAVNVGSMVFVSYE
jgi:hypothetical protein